MTDRLYAKYMWLISIISDAGMISFEDIAANGIKRTSMTCTTHPE